MTRLKIVRLRGRFDVVQYPLFVPPLIRYQHIIGLKTRGWRRSPESGSTALGVRSPSQRSARQLHRPADDPPAADRLGGLTDPNPVVVSA